MLDRLIGRLMSDYHRMVYATIGPWRFMGKAVTVSTRKARLLLAWLCRPRHWLPTQFLDNPEKSPLSGCWLFGARADMSSGPFQRHMKTTLERAHTARRGIFEVNGRKVDITAPPCNGRWDVDPLSGRRWPADSVFTLQRNEFGDVRFPWELDRLHQLVWYGQAWRYTADEAWPAVAVAQLEQVLQEAPFEHGIHWRDGLQLAVRIYSLAALADLCHDAPSKVHRHVNNAVAAHAYALARQMSPHSEITNNHAIGEACALALAGAYLNLPGHVRRGLRRLRVELRRQLYADGVPYEGAIPYIRFDLDFLTLLALALRGTGRAIPPWLLEAVDKIAGSLSALADAKGRIPPIGDGDDGRVLRLDDEPYLMVNESLHVAGSLVGKAVALAPPGGAFALWATGPAAYSGKRCDQKTIYLRSSGLVHLRRDPLDVWIDCGPTGCGAKGPGGHGHNDMTAIVLHLDGAALLHDPGWYTYHGDRKLRDQLRGTGAHNTLKLDGAEQARLGGIFEILDDCQPTPVRIRELRGGAMFISCGHTGYDRLGKNIRYRRIVLLEGCGPWRLRVTDRVHSHESVKVEVHLGSDLEWYPIAENEWGLPGGHRLQIRTGQEQLRRGRIPCSCTTGVLEQGSGLDWTVSDSGRQKQSSLRSYICRWEFTIRSSSTVTKP
jgi:hypothetical protein